MSDLWSRAEELAARPYVIRTTLSETTDGEPMYLAENPELPGCRAQGETLEEAITNLADARIDFIYYLLEDNLPVPDPIFPEPVSTTTGTGIIGTPSPNTVTLTWKPSDKARDNLKDIAPEYQVCSR